MDCCPRERNLAPVWKAVQTFDVYAPPGKYAMDQDIERLFAQVDLRTARRKFSEAVLCALHHDTHEIDFPRQKQNAQKFLDELQRLRDLMRSIEQYSIESFSNALTIPRYLGKDPETEILEIEDRTATLQKRAVKLANEFNEFLTDTTLPDYLASKTSNREVPFTACLIDKTAELWTLLRAEPTQADLSDLTKIMKAVLSDFSYSTEVRGRNWLRDRILYRLFDRPQHVGIER